MIIENSIQEIPPQCFAKHCDIPLELRIKIEEFAYAYGRTYDSYLITEDNRMIFFSRNRKGVLGFLQHRKYHHIIGGLLAATEQDKADLLDDFIKFSKDNQIKITTFYSIPEDDLPIYLQRGFQATKAGEEPIVYLPKTDWKGKPYHWVRRQENYCKRQGLHAEEVIPSWDDAEYREIIAPELDAISEKHIKTTKHGSELKYWEGRFIPNRMDRKRLFIARSTSRIEAFIVCNPAENGQLWAIEIYRYRRGSPRGTIPFLWLHTMRKLKEEGINAVSLSLLPFYNCAEAHPGDSPFLRKSYVFWFKHLNWIFDVQGMYLFKSRFRPDLRPSFMVVYPKATIFSLRSGLRLWGVSLVIYKPFRLFSNWFKFKKKQRDTIKA